MPSTPQATATTALIAEDEPLLARALRAELATAWPELTIADVASDGRAALDKALALRPDVLFFDINMPLMTGLEAAAALADAWVTEGVDARAFPLLVFVSAYDDYALQAFETHAVDYLVKPVQPARLQKTVAKLKATLASRAPAASSSAREAALEHTLAQLRHLLAPPTLATAIAPGQTPSAPLSVIQASLTTAAGSALVMVPIEDVIYFEAADKYVRVLTADREVLIRTPLKDLLPQLDPNRFWQIHRGTIVRASAIESFSRDEAGKMTLTLRGRRERLVVSRLYGHLFKAM
ncbi:MAG: response regulator transcription factor [Burkholderiales bacterium]|nr:response regulator transcription factor [Burkholderiales bacterium]